ncbi:MAG: phosphoglycerate kinase [Acidobacteria bacterium]|nr:phosphoglycerate kinase [Acidobacteriota bacterium]
MAKLSIRDLDLKDKVVFMRVDFNVPLNDAGEITDDTRIKASLPSILYALRNDAKLILASHLGRPKGKPNPKMSLQPVTVRLAQLLNRPVSFARDCVGPELERNAAELKPGGVLLLENLRFHKEEEGNDPDFARQLAAPANVYINDAFGSAHRAHASTEGITHYVPVRAAGLLMEKELEYLGKALQNPLHPYVAIVGGAKVSDKIKFLQNLMGFADTVLIGGAMAYTFLKAQGLDVGQSRYEPDKLDLAREVLQLAKQKNVKFKLPQDHVVAAKLDASAQGEIVNSSSIPADRLGVDIGPATTAEYVAEIRQARMIIWNGPMGVFEMDQFSKGTMEIARAVAASDAVSIVGGGDSVAAVHKAGVADNITHISTGGGASLEFLSGLKLPGVEALPEKP